MKNDFLSATTHKRKFLIAEKGLQQKDIAERLKVSRVAVTLAIQGKPNMKRLLKEIEELINRTP